MAGFLLLILNKLVLVLPSESGSTFVYISTAFGNTGFVCTSNTGCFCNGLVLCNDIAFHIHLNYFFPSGIRGRDKRFRVLIASVETSI